MGTKLGTLPANYQNEGDIKYMKFYPVPYKDRTDRCKKMEAARPGIGVLLSRKIKKCLTWTALHEACTSSSQPPVHGEEAGRLVTQLIERGADVDSKAYCNVTPLHVAAFYSNIQAVEKLIQAGCKVNAKDEFGETALSIACIHGNTELVQLLLNHGCNIHTNSWGSSWYSDCYTGGRYHSAKNFDKFMERDVTKLMHCGFPGSIGVADMTVNINWTRLSQILIAHGASVDFNAQEFSLYLEFKYDTDKVELEQLLDTLFAVDFVFKEEHVSYIQYKKKSTCKTRNKILSYIQKHKVKRLSHMCRSVIRNSLKTSSAGSSIYPAIYALTLPTALQNYLALKDCQLAADKPQIPLYVPGVSRK